MKVIFIIFSIVITSISTFAANQSDCLIKGKDANHQGAELYVNGEYMLDETTVSSSPIQLESTAEVMAFFMEKSTLEYFDCNSVSLQASLEDIQEAVKIRNSTKGSTQGSKGSTQGSKGSTQGSKGSTQGSTQ